MSQKIVVHCDGTIDAINAAVQQIDAQSSTREGDIIINEGHWQWIIGAGTAVRWHEGIRIFSTGYPEDAGLNRNPKTWKTIIEVVAEAHNGDWRNVDKSQGGTLGMAGALGYGAGMFDCRIFNEGDPTNQPHPPPWKTAELFGIHFKAYINDIENGMSGLSFGEIPLFLVHHIKLENFSGSAISGSTGGWALPCRGIVWNYEIDNPYKDTYGVNNVKTPAWDQGPNREPTVLPACLRGIGGGGAIDKQWAYGTSVGNAWYWTDDIGACVGQFENMPPDNGKRGGGGGRAVVIYFEDGWIRKCRHNTASGGDGPYYVVRHSIIEDCIVDWWGSLIDAHAGALLTEVYQNEIIGYPSDERSLTNPDGSIDTPSLGQKLARGVLIRGGAALIWGNTFRDLNEAIEFRSDMGQSSMPTKNCFEWNNTFIGNNTDLRMNDPNNTNQPRYGIDYFDRAPNIAQDGFAYTPYPHPHPFRTGILEVPKTPLTSELEEGTYKITIPAQVQVGSDIYNFKQWEDGSTNPVRIINLAADTTITATYGLVQTSKYTLVISTMTGGTTEPALGVHEYEAGTIVTVTAIPADKDHPFKRFELDGEVKLQNPINVGMDADHALLAVFEPAAPPISPSIAFLFLLTLLGGVGALAAT